MPLDEAKPFSKEAQLARHGGPARRFNYADARQRYLAGETTVELAAEYGVSPTAVRTALNRMGVRCIPHWKRPHPNGLDELHARLRASTHCRRGHDYAAVGFYRKANGARDCAECARENQNRRRAAERARGITREKWGLYLKPNGPHGCRNCPAPAVELHHAIPRGKAPHARRDVRNGLPLCISCHRGWHTKKVEIHRDAFTAEEWAFVSSVELTGENIGAWLDRHYPPCGEQVFEARFGVKYGRAA